MTRNTLWWDFVTGAKFLLVQALSGLIVAIVYFLLLWLGLLSLDRFVLLIIMVLLTPIGLALYLWLVGILSRAIWDWT